MFHRLSLLDNQSNSNHVYIPTSDAGIDTPVRKKTDVLCDHARRAAAPAGGRREQCPVSNSNKYYPILFKLGGNVYGHNILAKFENGYSRPGHLRVMALRSLKFSNFDGLWSPTQTNIIRFFSNFGTIFMGILSQPCSKMGFVSQAVQELWPLITNLT